VNPILQRIGYGPDDKVIVVHADDVGMCQATVPAFFELMASGLVSSGSAMVPCPWFSDVVRRYRECAGPIDLGVHLTLTCEWDAYRWGAISTCDPTTGLLDEEGFFHRNQSAWVGEDHGALDTEIRAQVGRARQAGINVTHIDMHMFCLLSADHADTYVELGFELGLPVLLVREQGWLDKLGEARIAAWEARGMPVFDELHWMPLTEEPVSGFDAALAILTSLTPGLHFMLAHPAHDTPELRSIAGDWPMRVRDYLTLSDEGLRDVVRRTGTHVIGMKVLRDAMSDSHLGLKKGMEAQVRHSGFVDGVRNYYDQNTPRFTAHESGMADAIHREVWGPGVTDKQTAYEYINNQILQVIEANHGDLPQPLKVLDLGCGIGGTLFYLAQRLKLQGLGVTLSSVQVALARERAGKKQLNDRCRFLEASYTELPKALEPYPIAYAVESFLHGPDPAVFFASVGRVMPAGGLLIVCDDFLTDKGWSCDPTNSAAQPANREQRLARRDIGDFRQGWHTHSLVTTAAVAKHAEDAGFRLVDNRDFTPYLSLQRPVDRWIATFVRAGRWLPFRSAWWDSWVGGHAVQRCLLTQLIEFHFLVFEKEESH
jgi:cyclopropane fatty-acyl-phospholipid synthase-like methyltransferase/predicted glycoside hydrolase/deacetylase ChbG (UPF0249 family)